MSLENAIHSLQQGGMVLLLDDEDRENEADIVCPAEFITPEKMNFILSEARGLVCLPMHGDYIDRLHLPPMVAENKMRRCTNFTVSIEAKEGITTGISAFDRATTVLKAVDENSTSDDLTSPGHVFPLRAHQRGVFGREGHTEGSVDLMILAGLKPAAVIGEVMAPDGHMLKGDGVVEFAEKHQLPIVTVSQIRQYRLQRENVLVEGATANLPLQGLGDFKITVFVDQLTEDEIAVIHSKDVSSNPLVRVHSACFTGDVLGSMRCDCQSQLHQSLHKIKEEGGLLIYLPQEGRGIGLANKIKAYQLQEQGMDTVAANLALGFKADQREYYQVAHILKHFGFKQIRLLTNNPRKITGVSEFGIEVIREPLQGLSNDHNEVYLKIKADKLGHIGDTV